MPSRFNESDPPAAAPIGAPAPPKPPRPPVTITIVEVEVEAAPLTTPSHAAAPTRRYQVIALDGDATHAVKTFASAQLAERAAFHHALRTNAQLTLDQDILFALWYEAQAPQRDDEPDF